FRARRQEGEQLSRLLSAPVGEQASAAGRLAEEASARLARIQDLTARLAAEHAKALLARPEPLIKARVEGDRALLRALAQAIASQPGRAAFLGAVEEGRGCLVFAAAPDAGVDAGARLKAACAAVGGKGGGKGALAEGSCPAERLDEALQ